MSNETHHAKHQPPATDEASRIMMNAQGNIIDKLLGFVMLVEPWVADAACNDLFGKTKSKEIYDACARIRPIIYAAKQGESDAKHDLSEQPPATDDRVKEQGSHVDEWTPEYVMDLTAKSKRSGQGFKIIADAHNAEKVAITQQLAAERENYNRLSMLKVGEVDEKLRQQIVEANEKVLKCSQENVALQCELGEIYQQLLHEQAAIAVKDKALRGLVTEIRAYQSTECDD